MQTAPIDGPAANNTVSQVKNTKRIK